MDEWRYRYPSTALTRTVKGDRVYAGKFRGEADKLLYQLKNQMQFNALGQLKMTRLFTDGTVITAWSIFGQDFVNVDVTLAVGIEPKCFITLFDLPTIVQPMQYPGEIRPEEVEGVDYIKTYYRFDSIDCPGCVLDWNMLGGENVLNGKEDWELYKFHNPFIFHDATTQEWWDNLASEDKAFYGNVNPRPDDHCLYGLEALGAAEIIEWGRDEQGTYILWKVYTEYGYANPLLISQTRNGYGFMELMPFVGTRRLKPDGTVEFSGEVCSAKARITVDCCEKESGLRTVELWWESQWGLTCSGDPFIIVGDSKFCKVPASTAYEAFWNLSMFGNSSLYVFPSIFGGCLPFDWEHSGAGELVVPTQLGTAQIRALARWDRPEGDFGCHDEMTIEVKDRCNTSYEVRTESCCSRADPLSIGYTSLLMLCGQQQTFSAIGGCQPYTWSIASGGGTITQDGVYTAPATNPNCTMNPTITLMDCCGGSASISLTINCYTGSEVANGITDFRYCTFTCEFRDPGCTVKGDWHTRKWQCDGILISDCQTNPSCLPAGADIGCTGCTQPWINCAGCSTPSAPPANCWTNQCGCACGITCTCDVLKDCRTELMKEQGCCPLNPLTGLPY